MAYMTPCLKELTGTLLLNETHFEEPVTDQTKGIRQRNSVRKRQRISLPLPFIIVLNQTKFQKGF